jgi:hypothetical protein
MGQAKEKAKEDTTDNVSRVQRFACDVRLAVKDAPESVTEGALLPSYWEIDKERLYAIREKREGKDTIEVPVLASRGVILPVRIIETDDGEYVKLVFKAEGKCWRDLTVARETLANGRLVTSLARHGVPVTSNQCSLIVDFIADYIAANKLPRDQGRATCGWVGADTFVLGADAIGKQKLTIVPNPADDLGRQIIDAMHTHGDEQRHLEILREAITISAVSAVGLAAALAAPYLRACDLPPFGVHFAGAGGSGKTATGRIAMSTFGSTGPATAMSASGVIRTAALTPKALFESARVTNDLPFAVADLNTSLLGSKYAKEQMGGVLHQLVNGEGYGTKKRSGVGTNMGGKWLSTIISEGEIYVNELGSLDGLARRYIEVPGPFIDTGEPRVLGKLASEAARHYGFSGRRIISALTDMSQAERNGIREEHERIAEELIAALPVQDQVLVTRARAVAAMKAVVTHADLILELGIRELWLKQIDSIWRRVTEQHQSSDRGATQAERASTCLITLVAQVRDQLLEPSGLPSAEHRGQNNWVGKIETTNDAGIASVAIRHDIVRGALSEAGHSPDVWLPVLASCGTIEKPSTGKRLQVERRLRGAKTWCYVINTGASGNF